jgi:hypothetical protein
MSQLSQRVDEIKVDLTTFDGLVRQLRVISEYVQYDLSGMFKRELLARGQKNNLLGSLPEGQGVMSRMSANVLQIQQELSSLQARLQKLVTDTGTLHDTYKTLEEKNRADIDKVKALLTGPGAPGAPAAPGQV